MITDSAQNSTENNDSSTSELNEIRIPVTNQSNNAFEIFRVVEHLNELNEKVKSIERTLNQLISVVNSIKFIAEDNNRNLYSIRQNQNNEENSPRQNNEENGIKKFFSNLCSCCRNMDDIGEEQVHNEQVDNNTL